MSDYELLDSGNLKKLERFGEYILERPSLVAVWPQQYPSLWKKAHATFIREEKNEWMFRQKIPTTWVIQYQGLSLKINMTDFGHLGIFPEHALHWSLPLPTNKPIRILNLFAYTGGATLSFAKQSNVEVCHVDASKKSVAWAKENALLSHLENAKIRWIIDDVRKFLAREIKRNSLYDAIILDPPTYGRGTNNEIFTLETEVNNLLQQCKQCLVASPLFVLFTCHTPGFTPLVLKQLMEVHFGKGVSFGEMTIPSSESYELPSGSFAKWSTSWT
ncbi:MAG: class I SAM-dependent methyltransferase [Chlamydiales bacterium]|nr:class I SAM-dependent methyltransferase [Chlamydiales bacterium]